MDRLKKCGLNNLFEDIIDNEKVYVIDNSNAKHMEEYLNKWYGNRYKNKKIVYKKIDDINKIFCIKYVPCEKCQQAILDEKGNKEIYAIYNNSHEMRMIDRKQVIKNEKLYLKERYVLNRC